jgi:hypothetical protein
MTVDPIVKRAVAFVVALASVVAIAQLAIAQPAHASYSQCPSDYVCLFNGGGGAGTPTEVVYRSPGTCYNITIAAANNTADSMYNHLSNGHHVQFYDLANCTGQRLYLNCCDDDPVPAGTSSDFLNYIWDHRNKASSIWFNNS